MEGLAKKLSLLAETKEHVSMAELCTFKAGGETDILVIPKNEDELLSVLNLLTKEGAEYYLLGNGSNVLVRDGGYRGVMVKIGEAFSFVEGEGTRLTAGAGMLLSAVASEAARRCLTGLEFASGIPGSLGGAVFMNAGAYDGEMKQVLESVRVAKPVSEAEGTIGSESQEQKAWKVEEVPAEELGLSYRHSRLMEEKAVVLSATLKLTEGDREAIAEKTRELTKRRTEKQPLQYPSAGSFFKRPTGYFAGKLVQDAGLKGFSVGGAQISAKHSGFMINTGNATATDIVTLMHLVQARVKEQFGVDLEPEVRIIGEDKPCGE